MKNPIEKIKHDPSRSVSVGSEFDFWLNDKDDIYDELYSDSHNDEDSKRQKTSAQ